MSGYGLKAVRGRLSLLAKVVLPMAVAGLAIAVPAYASSTHGVSGAGAKPAAAAHQPVMIAPVPGAAPHGCAGGDGLEYLRAIRDEGGLGE